MKDEKMRPNNRLKATWGILPPKMNYRHPEVGSDPEGDLIPPPSALAGAFGGYLFHTG